MISITRIKAVFSVISIIIFTFIYLFYDNFSMGDLRALEWYSLIVFFVLLRLNLVIYKKFHIVIMFHVLYFVFLYGKVFGHLFNLMDIFNFHSLVITTFSVSTISESILIITLSLLYFNLFSIFFIPKKIKLPEMNKNFIKVGKFLLLVTLPFVLYKMIVDLLYILQNGYLSYYLGANQSINYYIPFMDLFYNLFLLGYFMLIAGIPNKKTFQVYSSIFIIISVLFSLKGMRSAAILPILAYFWFLGNFYKINETKLLRRFFIICFLLIGFSYILVRQRSDVDISFKLKNVLMILPESGTGINLLNLYIDNRQNLPENKIGYIFEPLTFPFKYIQNYKEFRAGQSVELVNNRESLNNRLTYYLNPQYFLNGQGLGTGYIPEMYEFGYLGIVFFSALLAILFGVLYKYFKYYLVALFSYKIIIHILFLPRGPFFISFWYILKFLILFYIVMLIYRILKLKNGKFLIKHIDAKN